MAVLKTHADSNAIHAKKGLISMDILKKHGLVVHTGDKLFTWNVCNNECVLSDNLKITTLETIVLDSNYVRTDLLKSEYKNTQIN